VLKERQVTCHLAVKTTLALVMAKVFKDTHVSAVALAVPTKLRKPQCSTKA
jgi:hypothetical protein